MIKVVAFDLDDTLWDVAPVIRRAEAKLDDWLTANIEALKFTVTSMRDLRKQVIDENPQLINRITEFRRCIIERAIVLSSIDQATATMQSHQAIEVFLQARNQIELFEGAEEVLVGLTRRYTLGALTNGNADIKRLGLGHIFSFAFCAEAVGAPKPAHHLFLAALKHTGIKATEMIYVGDDPRLDIDAARSLGLYTIWMDRGTRSAGEYKANAIVTRVSELPGAIATIEQMSESS